MQTYQIKQNRPALEVFQSGTKKLLFEILSEQIGLFQQGFYFFLADAFAFTLS